MKRKTVVGISLAACALAAALVIVFLVCLYRGQETKQLLVSLKTGNAQERVTAAKYLRHRHPEGCEREVVQALAQALRKDSSEAVRCWSALALGNPEIAALPACPDLIAAFEDDSSAVRGDAAYALAQIGARDHEVVRMLREALSDRSALIRAGAAEALGNIGPPAQEAIPQLGKLLMDQSEQARSAATGALKKIRGEEPPK